MVKLRHLPNFVAIGQTVAIFRFFKTATAAIVDFKNFTF